MGFLDSLRSGLKRSREAINEIFYMGGEVDEDFWEDLEDTLVMGDMGAEVAMRVTDDLRDQAARENLTRAEQIRDALARRLAAEFPAAERDPFTDLPSCVLFVGINGAGKTTTVGKLAGRAREAGASCLIGGADTFRAAAIEQLEVWGQRAGVDVVTRERGADPASVCYEVVDEAERRGSELVLIDTAGRLHTSADLMRELEKVVGVVRKRSKLPVHTVLVIDATTGQNGLQQAREFNRALHLDALIVTKLDGTAKGGIALAVSHELELPIIKIGVGEGIDDLRDFDADDFAAALIGDFDDRYEEGSDGLSGQNAKEAAVSAGERRRDVIEGAPAQPGAAVQLAGDGQDADGEGVALEAADADAEAAAVAVGAFGADEAVEAAAGADEDAPAPSASDAADGDADDDAPFTDEELAELALADAGVETGDAPAAAESETAEAEPKRKKHFWEKWW